MPSHSWKVLFIFVGLSLLCSSLGGEPKGGCDLSLTKPCRSNSSQCVPLEHIDDGIIDCPDGSDEDCEDGWFVCADLSACIEPRFYQDGEPHCHDESDEACDEWQHECLCGIPRCIDSSLVGDGVLDCSEGSDELAIEKETYICPTEVENDQDNLRKKRRALELQARDMNNGGGITNFYSVSPGSSPPLGVLTSTVFSFVNKGTTSEYLTNVKGTSIDGSYAQITSISSRTFFALPTRIKENEVNGLVSEVTRISVSEGYTQTIVSRIYHTTIDGTYAQLVETETKGVSPTNLVNYVTILQGEELHGTFLSHPEQSLATLQFSHLEGSLNPTPTAEEIVTVTGTYGKFIRDGPESEATYSVFTGSYVKDHKTYMFFFGNSALPSKGNIKSDHMLHMKQGNENGKVILDMEKDMKVIMPSELKMKSLASKNDFLVGEGMVDGHKMDGLFIADSKGFDVKGAQIKDGGDIKMLTVTIGKPSTVMMDHKEILTKTMTEERELPVLGTQMENEENNEIDASLLRGRKANFIGDEIIQDINPTRPLPSEIHTFVIEEPNQNIGDILLREKLKLEESPVSSIVIDNDNVVDNIKAKFDKFDISEFGNGDSELPTVTYYGFAEFTTTIADTVVVFSPNSQKNIPLSIPASISNNFQARVTPSKTVLSENNELLVTDVNKYSTVSTKVFNTVDLYPSGLVSSIAGTVVNDDMTTLFTTLVYGTYIEGQYAQVVRSTSSIFYIVPRSSSLSLSPTNINDVPVSKTLLPNIEENSLFSSSENNRKIKENIFDSLLNDFQDENAIARSVQGDSNKNIIVEDNSGNKTINVLDNLEDLSTTTYTLYTTFVEDGTTVVSTNFKTTVVPLTLETVLQSTLTHHKTIMTDGSSVTESSLEVLSTGIDSITPSSNLFFNILDPDLPSQTDSSILDEPLEAPLEIATESSSRDMTEAPGFSLESSLNPENEINAIYFPRTYYTTYTYFTTYHRLNTSSIVSSLETKTNIITNEEDLEAYKSLIPSIATYPVTYWTTYTYWTTLLKDNSSITTSSKKTVSNVVHLTSNNIITSVTDTTLPVKSTEAFSKATSTKDVTTYYTTYTYYTTATIGDKTIVSTRLETSSSIIIGEGPHGTINNDASIEPFGLLFDYPTTEVISHTENVADPFDLILDESHPDSENLGSQIVQQTSVTDLRTGLLSTIRRSNVNGGITTLLSTNIYGTFIDGLYVQIQSTTSEILSKTADESSVKQTGVVTVNAGSIIEHGVTTHYTTQHVVNYVDGKYIEDLLSTSSIEIKADKHETTNPTKTGRVKEIIGSIIHGTATTYYHSTVLGTVIGGIYAQKVESTSRFVTGPSISFDLLTASDKETSPETISSAPVLEASIKESLNPTPVIKETKKLKLETTESGDSEKSASKVSHTNRLSFPIRTTRRRTDDFPFIKRTSIFQKQEALSKVLAAPAQVSDATSTTPKPEKTTTKSEKPKPLRSFRFGNLDASHPRHRFNRKDSERTSTPRKVVKENVLDQKQSKDSKQVTVTTTEKQIPPEEKIESFKQFRFQEKTSVNGTRSSLPIPRRNRPSLPDSTQNKSNRFRFGSLPETTTKAVEFTTPAATTSAVEVSKSQRPNPFSFLGGPISEKRKHTRQRKPEKEKPQIINRPSISENASRKPPRPRTRLGGLLPRRRPIAPSLQKDETHLIPVYLYPDGSPVNINFDDIDIIDFTHEDAVEGDQTLQRKKRQTNFGSRTTSRGSRRFARQKESNIEEKIDPSPSIPSRSIEPFTLSNPRTLRPRGRGRDTEKVQKLSSTPIARVANPRLSKSRNTLPFRPRRPLSPVSPVSSVPQLPQKPPQRQSFRRPSSDNRLRISNRFTPQESERNPNKFNVNRNRSPTRDSPGKNPIKSFLSRPKPAPKPKPEILPSDNGKFEIVDVLTVTREVPVTTTIPLIENGLTVEKKVITASLVTETVRPEEITQTEINGEVKLLLSTTISKQRVTQIFIQPVPTTLVTYTTEFLDGVRTSAQFTLPHTYYSIVTVTAAAHDNDVQDLLKLLLLQQQQQNPLLAAFGLNKPSTHLETTTYVTTVTSLISTEIPIIFRGKPIRTTVVDTQTEVITATEIITKTLTADEANSNAFGGLLPLLLQNQLSRRARDIPFSDLPINGNSMEYNRAKPANDIYDVNNNEDKLLSVTQIDILPAFNEIEEIAYNLPTPPLIIENKKDDYSEKYFLSKGPAELAPLRRKVRSAQRGNRLRQAQINRNVGGRKIENTNAQNDLNINNVIEKPATYYTTFTYYTTYLDDLNREIIKSSEETITQIAAFENIKFDDFTRINPTGVVDALQTSISVQENFTLKDAIIPGMPRPVPDPVFEDPDPPHGPVIRHKSVNAFPSSHLGKPVVKIANPNLSRGRIREETGVPLDSVNDNSVDEVKDSLPLESNNDEVSQIIANSQAREDTAAQEINTDRRRVRIVKITKKRPAEISNTNNFGERPTLESETLNRIVVTRRLPQAQATALASPVDHFMGTINTLYTVYSYLYTIYNDEVPASYSTRIITVSNVIDPTVINIPKEYQTISPTSNLYTIEEGVNFTALDDRVQNGYTTKIAITSATLVNIPPKVLHHTTTDTNLELDVDYIDNDYFENDTPASILDLQSSLRKITSTSEITTPTFTRSQIRRPQRIHTRHSSQISTAEVTDTTSAIINTSIRSRGTARFSRPLDRNTLNVNENRPSLNQRRNRFNFRSRGQQNVVTTESPVTDVEDPYVEEITDKSVTTGSTISIIEKPEIKNADIFDTVFGEIGGLTESPEKADVDLFDTVFRELTESPELENTSPAPTTSKTPRSYVRRDDIPIVRRPNTEKEPREFAPHHRLRFNITTTDSGRAVFASDAFEQLIPSPKPVGIMMTIDGKQNLATKVMDNGVEVIVAEDKTLEQESTRRPILRPSLQAAPRPITLPPSTLSNQMLLFASPTDKTEGGLPSGDEHELLFHYKTYFTTLTYYNTILQNGEPVVRTSKETISNLVSAPIYVSGKFVEKTKIKLDTSTYLETQTFTKTVGDLFHPEIITSKEVITQVVVTEVPSVSRLRVEITPTFAPVVTRTYYTTFTYYNTYDNGVIETETVVSSDIVTDTVLDPSLASLPVVQITKSPDNVVEDSLYQLFATKTYFTTTTYLTTLLEGDRTVTSSHIEVTSNVVTEPITAILNTDELFQGATVYPVDDIKSNKFEDVYYISLKENVYKELKTLFATYTHYTTLHNGRVKSNELTKTQLITSIVTTTYVPSSLLISPSESLTSHTMTDQPEVPGILDYESDIELEPSYVETIGTQSPTISQSSFSSESSGLKATVHVEEGSNSDTFIVQDSTTKATLLVRPTEEAETAFINILASSQLSLVETTTSPSFDFDDILSVAIKPTLLDSSTTIGTGGTATTIIKPEDATPVPTRASDEKVISSSDTSEKLQHDDKEPAEHDQVKTGGTGTIPEKEESGFGIGLTPMLTAVAGLIGNTFTGKLAGQTAGARRKIDHPILPKSAIVSSENEPLFIPVGGVGASLSDREGTIQPEQGFIPLRRPGSRNDFVAINMKDHDAHLNIDSFTPVSMESFGPTFRPPIKTESGFTAITTGINPTKVSVISGEETIFFGGIHSLKLPPPGQSSLNDNTEILVQAQSSPVHLVIDNNNGLQSHLLLPDDAEDSQLKTGENNEFRPAPKPTLVDLDNGYYYYTDYDNIQEDIVPDYVEESTSEYPILESGNEESTTEVPDIIDSDASLSNIDNNPKTTVVLGSSTILSGATTVFDNLYTRPSHANFDEYETTEEVISDKSLQSLLDEFTKARPNPIRTRFNSEDASASSDIILTTQSLRTLVSSVNPESTILTNIKSSIFIERLTPSPSYSLASRLQTLTISSSTVITTQFDDSDLYRNAPEYLEEGAKVKLGYNEENEVNHFVDSQSPDQELDEPQRTIVCKQECSQNEVCKVFRQEQVCICKPGFSRRSPSDPCEKSLSYQINIILDRLSDNVLSFSPELKNKSHPNTQFLMKEINSGIEKAMMSSDLGKKYHSNSILEFGQKSEEKAMPNLLAKIKIDMKDEEDKLLTGSLVHIGKTSADSAVQKALESSLLESNYSLGGGEVYTRKEPSAVLAATDFDECSFDEHNDCHKNAKCINLVGTFRCKCKEEYQDLFPEGDELKSGRQCVETRTCSSCNYNGRCQRTSEGTICICNDWFSGEKCEINMKVMLISVISVSAFLLLLFFIFVMFCCCKPKKDNRSGLLRGSSPGKISTLDRRAMIHDTSSDSSEDNIRHQPGTIVDDNLPPMPRTPQADYSLGRRSAVSLVSKDRSMRVHTTIPAVLIPRIKTYNSANREYTLERNSKTGRSQSGSKTKEEKLVDVLDGRSGGRLHAPEDVRRSRETILSVHSFNAAQRAKSRDNVNEDNSYQGQSYQHTYRVNKDNSKSHSPRSRSNSRPRDLPIVPRDHQLSPRDQVLGYRSRSADRLEDQDRPHNVPSDVEISSYRYGDRTVSQARSYDETTVRPQIRAVPGESFRSREVSSQVLSEGMPTNAERDGNSTIVYPQMQLYKPLRNADSISDLTGHPKNSWE